MKRLIVALVMGLGLYACAESRDDPDTIAGPAAAKTDQHVWQEQTDALQKARNAEKLLEDAQKLRKQQLDDAVPPS